jgi:hypothetical protein
MALLNCSLNLVAYADAFKNANPQVKFTDLKWSLLGIPTASPQMVPIHLAPGESQVVMSTERAITYTTGTTFTIQAGTPGTSNAQLAGNFGARTARDSGDDTTQWAITVLNGLVTMTWTSTGTAPNFGGIMAGDGVTLETGFSQFNQGDFTILKVGSNFIQFKNNLGVEETDTAFADIYSSGPVQKGDILDISSNAFSFNNQGQFTILRVTDEFVEFCNPNFIPEVITGVGTNGVVIYPEAQKWILIATDQSITANFNGDDGVGCVIEPPIPGDIASNPGLLLKHGKIFELMITNSGIRLAQGFVFLSQ